MFSCKFFVVVVAFLDSVICANILLVTNLPSPSHHIWNYNLAEGLFTKGHNVTMLGSNWLTNQPRTNYHPIDLEEPLHKSPLERANFDPALLSGQSVWQMMSSFYDYTIMTCGHSLNSKGFNRLMNYPKNFKFDLIIFDLTVGQCMLPLIQVFNYPPAIGITAFLLPPYISEKFGNDIQPSYLPGFMLKYSDEMSFIERVQNYFWLRLDGFLRDVYLRSNLEKIALKNFGEKMDSLTNLENHISLLLCNLSPVFHYPQPLPPNIIPVGGLHIQPAGKLPKDLQEIMDKAEYGVILFSFGSNIRSDSLSVNKRQAILDALRKVKQIVLWKFESNLTDVPKNVIIRKWLPQTEILAHPNIKLFISHGGGLSTLEAAYFGVPVIGIPFFVDQYTNMDLMVKRKIGVKVIYDELSSFNLLNAINEILQKPRYVNNIKELSRRMADRPLTPLEEAVFWTEYAIRHNGTKFLNPRSRDMSLFVTSCTDVHLFLVFIIFAAVCVLRKMYKIINSNFIDSAKKKSE